MTRVDFLGIVGIATVVCGLWGVYPPAAVIAAGVAMVISAMAMERDRRPKQ